MSFSLPTQNHPARQGLDIAQLAVILDPANVGRIPTTMQARRSALTAMEADKAIRSVNCVIIRQDTAERWLISVGRRGGWKKLWNFGAGA